MGATLKAVPREGELRLPEISGGGGPSSFLVGRAVGMVLAVFAGMAALGVVAGVSIETELAVDGRGTLEPVRVWPVRSPETAVVEQVLVSAGDTVAAGQVLVRLDGLPLRAQRAELEAEHERERLALRKAREAAPHEEARHAQQLAQGEAGLVHARAVLRQRLAEFGLAARADSVLAGYRPGLHTALDIAVSDVRRAEAELRSLAEEGRLSRLGGIDRQMQEVTLARLRRQIELLRERERRLDVAAPAAGVVLTAGIEGLLRAGVREGEPLLEVEELREWRAALYVSERDVHRIRPGDPVKLEVEAFKPSPRAGLTGVVAAIAPEPVRAGGDEAAARSAPYRVEVALSADARARAHEFRRGYGVTGKVVTRTGTLAQILWYRLTRPFAR